MTKASKLLEKLRDVKSSKNKTLLSLVKDVEAEFKRKKVSKMLSVEPLEGHFNVSSGFGGTIYFIRVHDLDEDEILGEIYHTTGGMPHPLKPGEDQISVLVNELAKRSEPSFDEIVSMIAKAVHSSKKHMK